MPQSHSFYVGPVTGELKNWYSYNNTYLGNIYGDTKQRWKDGTLMRTSEVVKIEERNDCFIVITLNSVYRLWKCDKKEDNDAGGEDYC